jgi:MFS family permease
MSVRQTPDISGTELAEDGDRPVSRSGGVLGALVLAVLGFSLVQTSVVPILPALIREFGTSSSSITWVMTANLLSAAVCTPLLSRIGDIRGRKPMLLVSLAGVVAGSVLAVATHSFALLVVARVLQGTGGAVMPLAIAMIRDELPREKVTGGVALVSASLGIGSGLGLVATGAVMEHWSYKSVFWMGLIIVAVGLLAAAALVPRDPVRSAGGADPFGALLLAGWLSALLVAVSRGNDWGWTSAITLGLFGAAVVLAVLWVAVERRVRHPLVDIPMMAKPTVALTNAVGALVGFAMYGSFITLSDFTQTPSAAGYGFGASVLHAGWLLFPSAVGSFLAAPIATVLIRRSGPRLPLMGGGLLAAVSLGMLIAWHHTQIDVYVSAGLMGLGVGFAYAAMPAFINGAVPIEQAGIANGMNAVLRTVGGAIGTAVAGTILTGSMKQFAPGVSLPTEAAYQHTFAVIAVLGIVAAIVPLAMRSRHHHHATQAK